MLDIDAQHDPADAAAQPSPIAASVAELDTLGGRGLPEHIEVYERIHAQLQDALGSIEDA
jgi:hypothetical protein